MPYAIFEQPDGEQKEVDVPEGWSLMEAARRDNIVGIEAECGGGAICGTCHVHLEPEWVSRVPPADDSEAALLSIVPDPSDGSRLACQIVMSTALDGIRVRVPAEQLSM
jgi:2Fe-2S ferredoxin